MRDRLHAPLEYIARERGYTYSDKAYELPRLWLSQEELTALLISARLATMLPDNGLKQSIDKLLDELVNTQALSQRMSIQDLKQRISLKNTIYTHTPGATFRLALEALLRDGALEIEYYSPHSGNFTERIIVPLHMVCYMGSWHVIAHCCMRGELRDFALGRIKNIRSANRPQGITFNPSLICEHLNNSFGIMTGEALTNVCLRFNATTANLISEQIWHPEQWTEHLPDGVILNFPVTDLTEIKREVLKFGSGVEVLAPNELRQAVANEIAGMQKIYVSGQKLTEQECHPGASGDITMEFYAHSKVDTPITEWQELKDHLRNVALMAADFAVIFGADQWAYLAGLWHDLGKYLREFQDMLLCANGYEAHLESNANQRVNHSSAGGLLAKAKLDQGRARILAYIIMGHHAGLSDYRSDHVGQAALECRLRDNLPPQLEDILTDDLLNIAPPSQKIKGAPALWIRMLYSCLVDADFLDTEAFMDPDRHRQRQFSYPSLDELQQSFDQHMQKFSAAAKASAVNRIRAEILAQCIQAAQAAPQIFSLTVPTGGGKTLASLGFALNHAVAHGKRRIIYVIPFTSIIEQTSNVFRGIPGFKDAVIEHHSNLDAERETASSRLASENWDAPLIVTTAVQFFESLYACRSSRCRKLHNIAESVVIFDEAQTLPADYLRPCLKIIKDLTKDYGVTPLLCTATQPALLKRTGPDFNFGEGFERIQEIVDDPRELFKRLKRVDIELHQNWPAALAWEDLAQELADYEKVLCIVNRRDDCRALHALMPNDTFHLSALMCGQHRSHIIAQIKERLRRGQPTRVISTQLVEAGVDLDFPVVYRAVAGLDSINQAAGRCNREGLLPTGRTVVFMPPTQPPLALRQAAEIGRETLEAHRADPFCPAAVEAYFKQLFWQKGSARLDKHGILDLVPDNASLEYAFRSAADKFRLIDDGALPVIVNYETSFELLKQLEDQPWQGRAMLRRLQRYTVSLNRSQHAELLRQGHIRELQRFPGVYVQETSSIYTEETGWGVPSAAYCPDDLII